MSEYKSTFFIVPSRILEIPGLTLAYLKIYETIFQFLNRGKKCYLSNDAIMERTNISSKTTIKDALVFFELHNELKRETINGKRYIKLPEIELEIEEEGATRAAPLGHQSGPPPATSAAHNNKKVNIKNNNKNYCSSDDEPQFFDEFWKGYPRKQKKKDAILLWKKKKFDKIAAKIIDDVKKRTNIYWQFKQKEFIPLPTTYLNGDGWTDELIEPAKIEPRVQKNEIRSTVPWFTDNH